ncbi:MAG: membrane protein insertase YidC [Campylobacterales bacterium]|nr:membrane protein insertase YidC [Campylobacterales bacterium]
MEQQDLSKRLLLALFLSILVFIGFSYLMPNPQTASQTNAQQNATIQNKGTPVVSNNSTAAAASAPVVADTTSLVTVTADRFTLSIDNMGRISQMTLLESKYKNEDGSALKLFDPKEVKPLEIRFSDTALNDEAFKTPYTADKSELDLKTGEQSVKLTQQLSSVAITKTITFKPTGEYNIKITASSPVSYFITPGYRPVADTTQYMVVKGALINEADNTIAIIEDGDAVGGESFKGATIASAFDRYYTSLLFDLKQGMNVSLIKEANDNPLIFISGTQDMELGGYIGPKDYKMLEAISPKLTSVIEYGWFTWLAKPFFWLIQEINDYIGNWGWAIVIFTILIKVILFWPSYKGMLSMQKLKDLAPKMKDIKEKYKDDPAKMQMKMMELYKKHGANPFGGCLPLLMQIPIFFALYRVLLNADELQGAPWILWIHDLSKMDPYYILPLVMGATMWYQQRITPSNFTDPLQEKIFKFFPVLMTFFFITFPSGLVLYWLTNNILSIGQQYYVNLAYEKHKQAEIEAHHHKG